MTTASAATRSTVGVDVGGTKIAALRLDERGQVADRVRIASQGLTYEQLVAAIGATVDRLDPRAQADCVGVALAANIARDGDHVMAAPHLPLRGRPVRSDLEATTGRAVVLENDASAAAWAEQQLHFPAAHDLLLLTVGTGLGGGIVAAGALLEGASGFAGEPGHLPIVQGGRACPCGGRGCWEQYASGSALRRAFTDAGGTAAVAGDAVADLAREKDAAACAAFTEIGTWLGFGLAGLVAVLDPAVVVLGGGVADAGDLLLTPTRQSFVANMSWPGQRELPELVLARGGNDAGAVGVALLARGSTSSAC